MSAVATLNRVSVRIVKCASSTAVINLNDVPNIVQ